MTARDFCAALGRLGMSPAAFARAVSELGGVSMPARTVQYWAGGERPVHPAAAALVALMQRQMPEPTSRSNCPAAAALLALMQRQAGA